MLNHVDYRATIVSCVRWVDGCSKSKIGISMIHRYRCFCDSPFLSMLLISTRLFVDMKGNISNILQIVVTLLQLDYFKIGNFVFYLYVD
ncbi:hypothetical protein MIMGU_mgv1a017217mg [Erythranthe guttata]|uniref:Uncharacterized protein n=1 Tax=Erythranthe guttata TaxID=4155 RepID=A0A022PPR1_ERYGU|nr:hypothetical protein MIMGU_mgv1a017217mg [Erythranthe guttata]